MLFVFEFTDTKSLEKLLNKEKEDVQEKEKEKAKKKEKQASFEERALALQERQFELLRESMGDFRDFLQYTRAQQNQSLVNSYNIINNNGANNKENNVIMNANSASSNKSKDE